jgi:hypothetical protein
MPDIFSLVSRHFWLIALAFSSFNCLRARRDVLKSEAAQRASSEEHALYFKRFAFGSALPWVVMGVGQLTGSAPTVQHYFRPQDGNPFVLAWFAVCFAVTCIYAWWVVAAGGAQKVRDLNLWAAMGQRSSKPPSLFSIKAFAATGPLFFLLWVVLVVWLNAPLPK